MPTPTPAGENEPDAVDEDAVQERLNELDEAVERAEEGDVEEPGDTPFSGEESADDVDVDVADIGVGEEVDDGADFGPSPGGPMGGMGGGPADQAEGMMGMMEAAEDSDKLAETINEGFARLSVVGLDREHKMNDEDDTDALEYEFREVFEKFRLGEYGSEALERHVFSFDDDVDPIWGFFGAMVVCAVVVVSQRPDGDQLVMGAKDRVTNAATQIRSD